MDRFDERELLDFGRRMIGALGASRAAATAVADSLVQADVRGVPTHGLVRLPSYRRQVEDGEVQVKAEPRIARRRVASVLVDGGRAFGALTANFCVDLAIERAERCGVGAVSAYGCMHFGTAAHYALRAARHGMVGLAAANTPGLMAPFGGAEPALGNNPFALAAPMPGGAEPFVLDMAQTVVARGRIKLAEMEGEPIPAGWALDPDGRPTTDPTEALAGALLPFGGYKGYGLALAVETLTGVLAGAGLSPELANTSMTGAPAARRDAKVGSVGGLFLALDPEAFAGLAAFAEGIGRLTAAMKAVRPAEGFAEVLIPGEPEARAAARAATEGVPLRPTTLASLEGMASDLGVAMPKAA